MNFSRADGDNQLRCPFFQKSCFYTTFENANGLKACGNATQLGHDMALFYLLITNYKPAGPAY